MVKETTRKERPKSMYDNVQYSPDRPPSWQYYRCMSAVIKIFELIFSALVFIFGCIWVQKVPDFYDLSLEYINYGPSIWIVFTALLSITITVILCLCLCCCVIWMVKKGHGWFCFEFFIHIFMIVLWFIASIVSIIFAVLIPTYYIICACVFCFFAELMYSVDCNMQFIYWREAKRRNIYKHSMPLENQNI